MFGKIREFLDKIKVESNNYPIKSGSLIGDLVILVMGSLISVYIWISGIIYGDGSFVLTVLSYSISWFIAMITVINTYYCIYRPMKKYEDMYGSTTLGDNWLASKGRKLKEKPE